MQNPFDWDYLTAPLFKTPTWGPFSIAFVALFGIGLVGTIILYNGWIRPIRRNRLLDPIVRRYSAILMPIFAIGLFFFAFRVLRVSAFNLYMRVWVYLCFLAVVAVVAYLIFYLKTEYPRQVANRKAQQTKQRYLVPSPSASSIGRTQRHSRRRKRARSNYKTIHH
ncbi:MAG TPA: hypothetical protein VHA53_13425 [Nitrolancea sp.]|nr:hypothetical protein [Nitrolancea sp.]